VTSADERASEHETTALKRLYPDAVAIFAFEPAPLETIKNRCLVVLDTNALLVPYNTGKDSLDVIARTLEGLIKAQRLVVPGQVAREFARNRAEKLKTLFQQISRKRDIALKTQHYPLLESLPAYRSLCELETDLESRLSKYRSSVGALLDQIRGWNWNDPVSVLYRRLFDAAVVVELEADDRAMIKDSERRRRDKVPPGYKDSSKEDAGIGDVLIWQTILQLGQSRKAPVLFVSGDEKSDWWYQSEGQALYPRFELVEEYRRESDGETFTILGFADFLKLFGASAEVVEEVRHEERVALPSYAADTLTPQLLAAMSAVYLWLRQRFPSAKLFDNHVGLPHFVIFQEGVPSVGYMVKFIRTTKPIRGALKRAHLLHTGPVRPAVSRLGTFFVTDNTSTFNEALGVLSVKRAMYPDQPLSLGLIGPDGLLHETVDLA
jgi:hypothetical protein